MLSVRWERSCGCCCDCCCRGWLLFCGECTWSVAFANMDDPRSESADAEEGLCRAEGGRPPAKFEGFA